MHALVDITFDQESCQHVSRKTYSFFGGTVPPAVQAVLSLYVLEEIW